VTSYLFEQLECKEKELFVVVTSEVEQNQSWQSGPHDEKRLKGSRVEEPAAHFCLEALMPDFNTRITPGEGSKGNIDRIAGLSENVDSVTQQLICNINIERTITSPLLELNR
jgi:hypothetical protein